ncbi:F-box/LRR-repeat protein At3g58900-like [Carex rostrata]
MRDRISALPNSLLEHILSYMPTKEAVGTSVLSKRWRKVWASVPVLEFDFADFLSEDIFIRTENGNIINEHSECHENFVRLIDAALASRVGQQIDRFTLVWKCQVKSYHYHGHPVRRWINLVLQHNPQVLSIYVRPSFANVQVPDLAFTCSSLVEMKLQIDPKDRAEVLKPNLVNLPSLKRLNLGYFTIKADFMSKLLLGCPKLEELELFCCGLNLSQISCSNLKSLVLDGCCNFEEIRVSVPSLQYLKVTIMSSQTAGSFVFENMSSLVKASVCFFTDDKFETTFFNSEVKILNGLSRVTNLDVVLHGSEAAFMLLEALENCPNFENLKAVHFENYDGYLLAYLLFACKSAIVHLVQHSPILENLTFYCGKDLPHIDQVQQLENLNGLLCEDGICQLVESKPGRIYESLDEIKSLLFRYTQRFEKMVLELATVEAEEEDGDGGGGGGGDGDDDDGGDAGAGVVGGEAEGEGGDVEQ